MHGKSVLVLPIAEVYVQQGTSCCQPRLTDFGVPPRAKLKAVVVLHGDLSKC